MYKKVLVPLDGSELAECVLPHLEAFIEGFRISDVTLVRVVEPEIPYHGDYPIDHEVLLKREAEMKSIARDYLDKIVNRLKYGGTEPHAEVIVGRVMQSLTDYAVNNDIDLIIIATHGYSGVTRWVRGSVADKILRSANMPVLMVRAPGTKGGI